MNNCTFLVGLNRMAGEKSTLGADDAAFLMITVSVTGCECGVHERSQYAAPYPDVSRSQTAFAGMSRRFGPSASDWSSEGSNVNV